MAVYASEECPDLDPGKGHPALKRGDGTPPGSAMADPDLAALSGLVGLAAADRDGHPRWTFHFTPASSSWLNAVEGFFAKLTRRRLKHGVFHSVVDLQTAINRFIAEHNEVEAKPFVWRAEPEAIIASRNRGFQALDVARE